MELEVGMYVRTNYRREVVIRKVTHIYKDSLMGDHHMVFDKHTKYNYFVEDNYYKASEDIAELIEVGDFINGHRVEKMWEDASNYRFAGCNYMFQITDEDIKTIVTKEQFESMCYTVEEGE